MNSQFGLIYFIHDDLEQEFRLNTLPNILNAGVKPFVKIVLVHNRRIPFEDARNKKLVRYETEVSEVVAESGVSAFKLIGKRNAWQNAFDIATAFLHRFGITGENTGLIILSHAAGMVINRNGEEVPIVRLPDRVINFVGRLLNVDRFRSRYFKKRSERKRLYVCSRSVVDRVAPVSNEDDALFESKYTRRHDVSYCKTYEGLFTHQLSSFFISKQQRFAFIIFSNCDIQLYDTGFLFSPITRFIIGAQSNSNRTVWDFPLITEVISANVTADADHIVGKLFDECTSRFSDRVDVDGYHYFMTDLKHFGELHLLFEKIVKEIFAKSKMDRQYKAAILAWVGDKGTPTTSEYHPFFDLVAFFQKADELSKRRFTQHVNEFKELLAKKIIVKRKSADNRCGFSLYLPRNRKQFNSTKGGICNYFNSENRNRFAMESSYDSLLLALFSRE